MIKNCLNCGLYMKVKGKTELGLVYHCHPVATMGVSKDRLDNYNCRDWREKLPDCIESLFGTLRGKKR